MTASLMMAVSCVLPSAPLSPTPPMYRSHSFFLFDRRRCCVLGTTAWPHSGQHPMPGHANAQCRRHRRIPTLRGGLLGRVVGGRMTDGLEFPSDRPKQLVAVEGFAQDLS